MQNDFNGLASPTQKKIPAPAKNTFDFAGHVAFGLICPVRPTSRRVYAIRCATAGGGMAAHCANANASVCRCRCILFVNFAIVDAFRCGFPPTFSQRRTHNRKCLGRVFHSAHEKSGTTHSRSAIRPMFFIHFSPTRFELIFWISFFRSHRRAIPKRANPNKFFVMQLRVALASAHSRAQWEWSECAKGKCVRPGPHCLVIALASNGRLLRLLPA